MKNTNCFKEYIKYSSLNVIGMVGLSCYILADTFFVSKGLGYNGLAALNIAIPVYSFIHGTGLMIGMGAGTKYAILKSQNKQDSSNRIYTNAFKLTILFASIFFIIGLFGSSSLVKLLGADENVFAMSKTYLQVILLFAPMFMMNNLFLCFVRNDGSPQRSMAAMIGGSVSNIILDYIFIFPLKMGIFGAVLATGIAPIVSMFILLPYFLKKRHQFHLCKSPIDFQTIAKICSNGLPSLITEFASGIVMIVFNTIILKLEGNTGVAAYGIIANISLVVLAIYSGIAQGIQPIISRNHGAGIAKNVRAILLYAVITVVIISGLIYLIIFFGANEITSIFNSEHNAILQNIAVTGLKFYFIGCLFAGLNIVISIYFTATEHPLPAQIIAILRGLLIIIPMIILLSTLGGIKGIWFAFPATEFLVSIISIIIVILFYRKKTVSGLFTQTEKR